jgi:hypothetical protein
VLRDAAPLEEGVDDPEDSLLIVGREFLAPRGRFLRR